MAGTNAEWSGNQISKKERSFQQKGREGLSQKGAGEKRKNEPGIPPILYTSSITYFPLGLRSAMNGTRSDTDWKSSIVRLMPTECAMAMRCSTAFVEPPRIIVNTYWHNHKRGRMRTAECFESCARHGPLRSRRRL